MSDDPIVLDDLARPWWEALTDGVGELPLFDAHTHLGQNDPDGFKQTPAELLAGLQRAGDARAVVFPMAEPGGYTEPNDAVLATAAASGGTLVPFCRVNPHDDAVAEAERALDAGARGIKLHPRAESFTLGAPAIAGLVDLAQERGLPILIHAGRGIPALGRDTIELAAEHPRAKLILAHAAVSDLSWLWRELPDHPNVFIDTSWWNPGDLITLFRLVAPGQILWASDSPYVQPLTSAAQHFRYMIEAGLGPEAMRSIAGEQLERVLADQPPLTPPAPPAEPRRLDPLLERIVDHLVSAFGVGLAGVDPAEQLALARLACAVGEQEIAPICGAVERIVDLAAARFPGPEDDPFHDGVRLIVFAMTVARTPAAPLPAA